MCKKSSMWREIETPYLERCSIYREILHIQREMSCIEVSHIERDALYIYREREIRHMYREREREKCFRQRFPIYIDALYRAPIYVGRCVFRHFLHLREALHRNPPSLHVHREMFYICKLPLYRHVALLHEKILYRKMLFII